MAGARSETASAGTRVALMIFLPQHQIVDYVVIERPD